jgi:hypothetical protein
VCIEVVSSAGQQLSGVDRAGGAVGLVLHAISNSAAFICSEHHRQPSCCFAAAAAAADAEDADAQEAALQALEAAAHELHAAQHTPKYWTDFLQVNFWVALWLLLSR